MKRKNGNALQRVKRKSVGRKKKKGSDGRKRERRLLEEERSEQQKYACWVSVLKNARWATHTVALDGSPCVPWNISVLFTGR